MSGAVDPRDDRPRPTIELKLIQALVTAHLQSMSPKKRARFIERVRLTLEAGAAHAGIARIRPSRHADEEAAAYAGSLQVWRSLGPLFAAMGDD